MSDNANMSDNPGRIWIEEEKERRAQEADLNRVGQATPMRSHKETRKATGDHLSSQDSARIGAGEHRHASKSRKAKA